MFFPMGMVTPRLISVAEFTKRDQKATYNT